MAANTTIIGRTARVRGRVTGEVDLEVQGFVEGEISVGGDVTVDVHGLVGASVRARRLVVRGAVKGDLVGEEAISLEEGARVVGDVRAPRVAIAPGALVRGYVETGEGGAASPRAARTAPAARPAVSAPKPVAAVVGAAKAPVAATKAPAPAQAAVNSTTVAAAAPVGGNARHGANHAAARRPPPPVVPALKKAKGQIAKKKER
jgi:cytoskeletal protein CcmA (bactofilin family)